MSGGALVVRVREEGTRRPVVGATVHVGNASGWLSHKPTDASGSADVRDFPDGWVTAIVEAPGFARSEPQWQTIGGGATVALHFELERAVAVEGVVVARDGGAPVAGARVESFRRGALVREKDPLETTQTSAAGRFRLAGVPRASHAVDTPVVVVVSHPELATADVVVTVAPTDDGPVHVRVAMDRGGSLRGVVTEASGAAVADARVEAHRGYVGLGSWSASADPFGGAHVTRPLTARSAADGSFAVTGLVHGDDYHMVARTKGTTPSEPVVARAGDKAHVLLRLRDAGRLRIRVVGEDGRPIAGATVTVSGSREHEAVAAGPATWDVDGIADERVFVHALAPGYVWGGAMPKTPPGRRRSCRIVLARAFALSGHVVDDLGAPVPGARVWAEHQRHVSDEAGFRHAAESGADGRFVVEGLPAKPHRVMARSAAHEPARIVDVLPPRDDLRIVLPRAVTVVVRLATPAGTPTPRSAYVAHAPRGTRDLPPREAASDRFTRAEVSVDDGVVRVTGVPPGGGDVHVFVPGCQRIERVIDADRGATVDLGVVPLEPALALEGRVADTDGRAVAGVAVCAGRQLFHEHEVWNVRATTAEDGRFVLRGLTRGRVTLYVTVERPSPPSFDVDVPCQDAVTLTVPVHVPLPRIRLDAAKLEAEVKRLRRRRR